MKTGLQGLHRLWLGAACLCIIMGAGAGYRILQHWQANEKLDAESRAIHRLQENTIVARRPDTMPWTVVVLAASAIGLVLLVLAAELLLIQTFSQAAKTLQEHQGTADNEHTLRQQHEMTMQAALEEKEALLREIHHRVKNNMQLVLSLLNITVRQVNNTAMHPAFLRFRDRMNAISLVHEALYQESNLRNVNFVRYVDRLVTNLSRNDYAEHCAIRPHVNVIPLELDTDRCIDIGLVLSELIANACQHAFRNKTVGTIRIEMTALSGNMMELVVADDGAGTDNAYTPENTNAFGLKLARSIIERNFGGDFLIQSDNGTRITMRFPADIAQGQA